MYNIVWIVGAVVIVLFVLGYFGLSQVYMGNGAAPSSSRAWLARKTTLCL
jgi:hypothetical protein